MYDSATYDTSNAFDTNTGIFRAPCAGLYRVSAYLSLSECMLTKQLSAGIGIRINDKPEILLSAYHCEFSDPNPTKVFLSGTDTVHLNAGDGLSVAIRVECSNAATRENVRLQSRDSRPKVDGQMALERVGSLAHESCVLPPPATPTPL